MRSKMPYGVSLILTVLCLTTTVQAGGGATSGDGYPTKFPPQKELSGVPAESVLQALLKNIALEFPTIAGRMIEIIKRLDQHQYALIHLIESNPDQYAAFEMKTGDRYPDDASVYVYNDFFNLPEVNDTPFSPSQGKVMLHELVHLLITHDEETKTQRVTEILYNLGRTGEISKTDLFAIVRDTHGSKYGSDSRIAAEEAYLIAHGLKKACQDFGQEILTFWEKKHTVPTIPAGLLARIESKQDPFFIDYRYDCLKDLPGGKWLTQSASSGGWLLNDPYILGHFVKELLGKTPTITLSLMRRADYYYAFDVKTSLDFAQELSERISTLAVRRDKDGTPILSSKVLEDMLLDYSRWKSIVMQMFAYEDKTVSVFHRIPASFIISAFLDRFKDVPNGASFSIPRQFKGLGPVDFKLTADKSSCKKKNADYIRCDVWNTGLLWGRKENSEVDYPRPDEGSLSDGYYEHAYQSKGDLSFSVEL